MKYLYYKNAVTFYLLVTFKFLCNWMFTCQEKKESYKKRLLQAPHCDTARIVLAYNLYSVFLSHNLRVSLPKIFKINLFLI